MNGAARIACVEAYVSIETMCRVMIPCLTKSRAFLTWGKSRRDNVLKCRNSVQCLSSYFKHRSASTRTRLSRVDAARCSMNEAVGIVLHYPLNACLSVITERVDPIDPAPERRMARLVTCNASIRNARAIQKRPYHFEDYRFNVAFESHREWRIVREDSTAFAAFPSHQPRPNCGGLASIRLAIKRASTNLVTTDSGRIAADGTAVRVSFGNSCGHILVMLANAICNGHLKLLRSKATIKKRFEERGPFYKTSLHPAPRTGGVLFEIWEGGVRRGLLAGWRGVQINRAKVP